MTRVRQAATEILIITRRFEFDAFGQMLLSELEYCCQRGLRVRCLLDADGCAGVIADHPALFTALETRFRIQAPQPAAATLLVFDRHSVMTGVFPLSAALLDGDHEYASDAGAVGASLAQAFEASWAAAREPRQT